MFCFRSVPLLPHSLTSLIFPFGCFYISKKLQLSFPSVLLYFFVEKLVHNTNMKVLILANQKNENNVFVNITNKIKCVCGSFLGQWYKSPQTMSYAIIKQNYFLVVQEPRNLKLPPLGRHRALYLSSKGKPVSGYSGARVFQHAWSRCHTTYLQDQALPDFLCSVITSFPLCEYLWC